MSEELFIEGWEAKGLRCPDHEVDFTNDKGELYPITLLQMPNGTGKTTTLELLRATLSGQAMDWDGEMVEEFKKRDSDSFEGFFKLRVLHNSRKITFELKFDFEENKIKFSTTKLPSGRKTGFHPPLELRQFLCPEFVKLFVFDGELAESLLDRNHTNAEAAVEELFQLPIIKSMHSRVHDYWEQKVEGRTATAERGMTVRKNRVGKLRKQIAETEKKRDEIKEKLEKSKSEISEKRSKFSEEIKGQEELSQKAIGINIELESANTSIDNQVKLIIDETRNPYALSVTFGERLVGLKDGLDRVKLPESAAKEFFEELAQEEECLCGRPIGHDESECIKNRAGQYLGTDDVSLLNAIKSDISSYIGESPELYAKQYEEMLDSLLAAVNEMEQIRTKRDAIIKQAARQNPGLEETRCRIEELEVESVRLTGLLEPFEYDYDDSREDADVFNPEILWKRLNDAEKQLAEITDTISLRDKRDKLQKILEIAHSDARDNLTSQLAQEANIRMKQLMPHNHIEIERIDRCLRLVGQSGGSVGETLAVGYAFLSTLFNRTEYSLPFVVDSPANPIDLEVRSEVAKLLPKLANQLIGFTISSEREGFLKHLENTAGDDLKYITMFRKVSPDLEESARESDNYAETEDGMSVVGREFFWSFHKEEE